ncbi:hypothetical protein [Phenylobacterium sp.]|uniref:hypothetical protein n=1 Tax=Phenylobacterium sp. TaxID=1871053 RepID=UPI0012085FA4|nr:hypothetical protein [Phenylobacterium sp.]THD59137.1 MAG: hypothetical protein E8A49_17190 [Phenylobacterium sp.]
MKRAWISGFAALVCGLPAAGLAADAGYKTPRNGFGQPDLGGAWSNATLTPQVRPVLYGTRKVLTPQEIAILEGADAAKTAASNAKVDLSAAAGASDNVGAYDRAWIDTGAGVMRVGGEARTSLITTEDGQVPPARGKSRQALPPDAGSAEAGLKAARQAAEFDQFAAQGAAEVGRAGSFDNPENRALGERCVLSFGRSAGPPMFPNGWYNNNYLIVQGPTEIAIDVEMVHDVRHIRLNARHRADDVRPWFGDSIGWWDGDTLVVETNHIPQAQAYNGSWKDLTVTERFTRVARDRIRYSFTVSDPTIWDRPWGGEYEMHPLKGQVLEYACHEGNYALADVLGGARAEERAAAAKSKAEAAAAGR